MADPKSDPYDTDANYELAKQVVNHVASDRPSKANDSLGDMFVSKVRDAISGKRVEVAQNMFNQDVEDSEEIQPELDLEVEDEVEVETEEDPVETDTEEAAEEEVEDDTETE